MTMPIASTPSPATCDLAGFQDAFATALLADLASGSALSSSIASIASQPGFAVYRNTVLKGCIDALEANFPAVARLVGSEWFRAAAACYAREHLPSRATLLFYGEDFPSFLAEFEPARELPYLPAVAQLDRCWTETHTARDEALLMPAEVASLGAAGLEHCVLRPHATARWHYSEFLPIATLWRRSRAPAAEHSLADIDWRGEGLLLVRPHDAVESIVLDAAGCAFLDACAAGATVLGAAHAANEREAGTDLSRLMADLLGAGAFASAHIVESSHGELHAERCV